MLSEKLKTYLLALAIAVLLLFQHENLKQIRLLNRTLGLLDAQGQMLPEVKSEYRKFGLLSW